MIPLITHRIGIGVCFQRQDDNYHKCHRCVYRGRPADFEVSSRAPLTPHWTAARRNGSVELQEPAPGAAASETGAGEGGEPQTALALHVNPERAAGERRTKGSQARVKPKKASRPRPAGKTSG